MHMVLIFLATTKQIVTVIVGINPNLYLVFEQNMLFMCIYKLLY